MSLKSFLDWLKEEEKKRQQEELASLNTDVNVFKNTPATTQSSTVKSGAYAGGGTAKVQNNAKVAGGDTSNNKHNTDMIDSDWGLNAKAYADMTNKLKKTRINKSTDMIDNDYGFNVKAMDDYLSKMRSVQKQEANKGAVIYDDVGDKIKDNKYASTMINIGKSFSNFGKYNHLNDLYYIDNPSGLDDGYKYITKDDMNKYFYLLAKHEKGDVDKKDVDDLKHYLFRIGEPIDAKDADELPPIEHKPDYSKISSEEQLIYDSFGNVVNKAKGIDYSAIPTDDQLPKEPGKVKANKSTDAVDRDYGLDLSSYKDMMSKNKAEDNDKPKKPIDYSKISNDVQLIYDSYGNVVNKPTEADYSQVQDTDHFLGLAIDDINEYKDIKESNFDKQLRLAIQQLVLGDYDPDEHTKLGTAAQMLSGFLGIDLPMDIRDLVYDVTHKDSIPDYKKRIFLDVLALLPAIGAVKNLNKVNKLGNLSNDLNIVDDTSDAFKNADEVGEGIADASKRTGNIFPANESQTKHIFRDANGHMIDTPTNRKLLENASRNKKNFLGTDKYGNSWYSEIQQDGTQVWVRTRNGVIIGGGINNTPLNFDPDTGLNFNPFK